VCGSQGGDAVICLYHTTTLEYEVQYVHATYVRTYYDLSDKAAEPEQEVAGTHYVLRTSECSCYRQADHDAALGDVMLVVYPLLLLLYRNIYHLTENLGIVSLDHPSNCLSVAGTQDPLT